MNYLEAIREDLHPFPVRTSLIERQCVKQGVSPIDENIDEKIVSMCVLEILSQMIALGGVSEGGVSFSFDTEKVKERIKSICRKNGFDYSLYIPEPKVIRLE